MTYKKILLSGLLLTLNSGVFCESFFKQLLIERLYEILNSIKSGANLLQSAAPAGSNTGNNAAGAATKPNNNGAAGASAATSATGGAATPKKSTNSSPSAAGAVAPAPIKFNEYYAKEFLSGELKGFEKQIDCDWTYHAPTAACVGTYPHATELFYIHNTLQEYDTILKLKKYIKDQIDDLNAKYQDPYFDYFSQNANSYETYQYRVKKARELNRKAYNNYVNYYKKIFNENYK